ncbi:peptidoglycan-binding protein [Allonocardiopsis opalescens]|uniref:Putative peptidoglycan binding protein n=1 Tax=Allonocardiopsis opalescens TaxID=1144618 RepID=A0A2T0Q2X3_9ACTN|nr:peptidoglycan-binding protein [Allonocardiopsis opalescens]PRX98070.1 putative peptidoglycan binding protein [Allonocardiopsis opalescens]
MSAPATERSERPEDAAPEPAAATAAEAPAASGAAPPPEAGTAAAAEGGPKRRRRLGLVWVALGIAVPVGAGAGYWYAAQDGGAASAGAAAPPVATTEVTRQTLTVAESFGGVLGHGEPTAVPAAAQGTVTATAEQGSQIERGTELFRIDERPVTAMYGEVPMFRDLGPGDSGDDVEQLEENLSELGYDGFSVDGDYDWGTEAAVRAWQDDIGAEETGTVGRADVVMLPGAGRVDGVRADRGAAVSPGAPVLDVTGADQLVSLDVAVGDRELFEVDQEVAVQLPGGEEVAGTVTDVAVVEGGSDEAGGGGAAAGAEDAVAQVEVAIEGEDVDDALLGSPVDVVVEAEQREDVLTVPVNALLALAEGGYGLEVVDGAASTTVVPVEAGLFAQGRVEVEGDGIAEGTVVGVAGR